MIIGITSLIIEVLQCQVRVVRTVILPFQDALTRVSIDKDSAEGYVAVYQVIGIFIHGCHASRVGLEIFVLGLNDLVGIADALLVVSLAVVDGSTPEVDIGQQGTHGVAREIAHVAPVLLAIGTTFHDVALGLLEVVDAVLQHTVGSHLRDHHLLVVVLVRLRRVGHVAEGAYQVEVAEAAQGKHLCTCLVVVALCEGRVVLHHVCSMVQHDVATVDDGIETLPRVVTILGKQVHCTDVLQVGIVVAAIFHQFV